MTALPPDSNEIARLVSIRSLLANLGWRVRNRKRADCGLCRGKSKGTIAFTDRLWKCHRCNEGGDVFTLVRAVRRCDFPDALRHVAELAGIRLEDSKDPDVRREVAVRKRRRAYLESAADKLEALERKLRLECRARIHDTERKQQQVSARFAAIERGEPENFLGEQEGLWLKLQAAAVLLETDLSIYTLLSFADPAERANFVVYPELREGTIRGLCWAGYVRTADGKQIEVLA